MSITGIAGLPSFLPNLRGDTMFDIFDNKDNKIGNIKFHTADNGFAGFIWFGIILFLFVALVAVPIYLWVDLFFIGSAVTDENQLYCIVMAIAGVLIMQGLKKFLITKTSTAYLLTVTIVAILITMLSSVIKSDFFANKGNFIEDFFYHLYGSYSIITLPCLGTQWIKKKLGNRF